MNPITRQGGRSVLVVMATITALVVLGSSSAMAQPANDDFDNATVITDLPFTDAINTQDATTAPDDPDCGGADKSVWYSFTPSSTMDVVADSTGSDYSASVSAWTGSRGALTRVSCDFNRSLFQVVSGETYYIMVSSNQFVGGNLVFTVAASAPPPNDDFDNATVIASLPFTDTVNTQDATTAADDPICASPDRSVWYSFTPSSTVDVVADTTGSDYDTWVSAWTGSRGALSLVACDSTRTSFQAASGEAYYIMVAQSIPGGPNLVFSLDRPLLPNDDFDTPTQITELPFSDFTQSSGATSSPDDPVCVGETQTLWYSFTAPDDLQMVANTFGSDYDTTLSAYTGSRGNLTQVACNNDSGTSLQSEIMFIANAGETYFFMVGTNDGVAGGQLEFTVSGSTPIQFTVAIDSVGSMDPKTGNALVHGVVTCDRELQVLMGVQLSQKVGRRVVAGAGPDRFDCL